MIISVDQVWRRRARFALLTVMLAVVVSACAEAPTTTPKPVDSSNASFPVPLNSHLAASPPFVLNVWFADDYYNEAPITDLMKEFKQAYPNITVAVNHSEWGRMRNRLRDAVGAGNPPDVAHQHAFVFGAQGFAEPLDDLWQAWGQEARNRFLPNALEDVTWNGVKYGVPLDINTIFLFYNKSMFKEAGLAEPGSNYTYAQLLSDARKLTKADGSRFGLAIKPGAWDVFGLVRSNGGELLDETGGTATSRLDDPANVQMLQLLTDMVNKDRVSPQPANAGKRQDPVDLFKQRKTAMFFSGPWDLKELEKNAPEVYNEVGTATMPKGLDGKTNGSVQGGGSLFVPKGAQHREAAFEFMKWAASPRYQIRLAREMGRFPVLNELYSDAFFTNNTLLQPFLEQLKTARPYKLEAYSLGDVTWENSIATIFTGSEVKPTLSDANRAVQASINVTRNR